MRDDLKKQIIQKIEKVFSFVSITALMLESFSLGKDIVDDVKAGLDTPFRGNEIVSDLTEDEIFRTTNLKVFQTIEDLSNQGFTLVMDDRKVDPSYYRVSDFNSFAVYDQIKNHSDPKADAKSLLLLQAIADNPNLTNQERDVFYRYFSYFKDNPYLNYQDLYKRLKAVDVHDYDEKEDRYIEGAAGYYLHLPLNEIVIQQHYDDAQDMLILGHEGFHATNSGDSLFPLPKALLEGMNELITLEYFSRYPMDDLNSYLQFVTISRMMCELVGADTMLEAFTKNDYWIVYDALLKIDPEEKKANQFLGLLKRRSGFSYMDRVEYDEFYKIMDDYYFQKYGQTIQETPIMRNYNNRIVADSTLKNQRLETINNPLGSSFQDVVRQPDTILMNCVLNPTGKVVKYYFNKTMQEELGNPYIATLQDETYYDKKKIDKSDQSDFWLFWYRYVDGKDPYRKDIEPVIQKYRLDQESLNLSRDERMKRYTEATRYYTNIVQKDYNLYGTAVQKPMKR